MKTNFTNPAESRAHRFLLSDRLDRTETDPADAPHPAVATLARRPRGGSSDNKRLTEYLRIDRGRTA